MGKLDVLREAREAARAAAIQRWSQRQAERSKNKTEIAAYGVGAADSFQRNARFKAREKSFQFALDLRKAGQLSLGLERKMGPTLDFIDLPPSEAARRAGRPVARIVEPFDPAAEPEGIATGFLLTGRLLMTNHHVFPDPSYAVGTGANFLYEKVDTSIQRGVVFEIDPGTFYVSDERLDYAIVAVKQRSLGGRPLTEFGVIPLIEATPKILIGHRVNIIQHPEGRPKQYAVSENRLVDILDEGYLHYETDTLEGSSGSPAFSESWELVALHHAAIPEIRDGRVMARNGKVWDRASMSDEDVHWIANEGTRVSTMVKHLSGLRLPNAEQQGLLNELLEMTTDPVDDLANEMKTGMPVLSQGGPSLIDGKTGERTMAGNQFNFTGPVTIHVHGSQTALDAKTSALSEARPAIAEEKVLRFDRRYDRRKGYDPGFLDPGNPDLKVPIPGIAAERENEILTDRQGNPLILKYHHYQLVMNETRRLQMWSAANVDYDKDRKHKGDRKSFGSDKWIPDPRIPEQAQIFDSEFYKPAGNIDRGHIVRREDNAWGDSPTEIEYANSDTFHWTNCTPQHEAFNQSDPARNDATYRGMKGRWGDFENYIQQHLSGVDTKACILAGPILDDDDPDADFGAGSIQYPLRFWKVIAVAAPAAAGGKELRVYGFILNQKAVVDRFGIEVFVPGRFRPNQVPLGKIEQNAGVRFHQTLHAADPMRGAAGNIDIVDGSEIRGLDRVSNGAPPTLGRRPKAPPKPPSKPR